MCVGKSVKLNHTGYILDPPSESSLPPLPPIPLPPTSQYRRSSLVTRSSAPHPIVKPPIPSSSPLSSVHTLDDCLAAFNGLFEGYIAQKRYEGGAVYVDLNCESAAWIFLNNLWQGEDPGVECVRMFTQAEATEVCLALGCMGFADVYYRIDQSIPSPLHHIES